MCTARMVSVESARRAPRRTSRSSSVTWPSALIIRYIASVSAPYSAEIASPSATSAETPPPTAIEGRWPRSRS